MSQIVAKQELCAELHKLSGWEDQTWWHCYEWDDNNYRTGEKSIETTDAIWYFDAEQHKIAPAYDLSYLLRKLPLQISTDGKTEFDAEDELDCYLFQLTEGAVDGTWQIDYRDVNDGQYTAVVADNPEDAACMMAIELFKLGILK